MTNEMESAADHIYKLMYGDLSICGCGVPGDAFALVRDLLGLTPFYDNPDEVQNLIGGHPGAYHLILSMLDEAGLIEHGGTIGGSWATKKGTYYLWAMNAVTWDQVDNRELFQVGYPHDGAECTDACWEVPLP